MDPRRRLSLRLATPRRRDRAGLSGLARARRRCVWWNTASAAKPSSQRAFMTSRPPSGGCVDSVSRLAWTVQPSVYGVSPREGASRPSSLSMATTNGSTARLASRAARGTSWPVWLGTRSPLLPWGRGRTDGFARSDDAGSTPDRRPYPGIAARMPRSRVPSPTFTRAHPSAVHGLEDGLLPPEQSPLMHEALQTVGASSQLSRSRRPSRVLRRRPRPDCRSSADFLVGHLA